MQIKLHHGGHKKSSFTAGLKQKFLNLAVSLPIKYKAPNVIKLDEGGPVSYSEARAKWDEVRAGLRREYETIDEKFIENELFKHPAAGKMNLIQSVKFMRQHMNRHIGQIQRTLKTVGTAI